MSFSSLVDVAVGTLIASHPSHPSPPPVVATLTDAELVELADRAAEEIAAGETIEVVADAPAESASSVHLGRDRLRYRLRSQASDVLRQVPGLVVSQHAGGGKSDQYFIRGFDADHGTDLAIFADGVPVNLTSHGHGQGYADAHFLIPETIESVDIHKGPYAARYGDFYTAGALELRTIDSIEGPTVWVASGAPLASSTALERYDRRLVGMASPRLRENPEDRSLIALQVAENDGPFVHPQGFRQGNALVKWKGAIGPGELAAAGTWYRGTWHQSGQLPEGEIAAGRVDRFGSLDPSEGGDATRASLQLAYKVRDDARRSTLRAMAYGVRNELALFSNFTLFARDPEHGDQIGQIDDRILWGLDTAYEKWLGGVTGAQARVTAGAQLRVDDVETGLFHTERRMPLPTCFDEGADPCNRTDNTIKNGAVYVEADVVPVAWLHVRPALRLDAFAWRVHDLDAGTANTPMTTAGSATTAIASPKLSVELHASEVTSFFLNTGFGFHSNDARAAVQGCDRLRAPSGSAARPGRAGACELARAIGAEGGVRMKPYERARVAADVWYLHLGSELVWSGDAGGTEPSAPTRRFGLDLEGSFDATSWLALDANVTWAHASVVANRGNGGAIALAPRWMGSGGIAVHDREGFVSLRARGIADRAGNEDGSLTAKGYLLFDLVAGRKLGDLDLELAIANLFDTAWREAQFAESSRVVPTGPIVEQMHFTPGMPRTATAKVAYRF